MGRVPRGVHGGFRLEDPSRQADCPLAFLSRDHVELFQLCDSLCAAATAACLTAWREASVSFFAGSEDSVAIPPVTLYTSCHRAARSQVDQGALPPLRSVLSGVPVRLLHFVAVTRASVSVFRLRPVPE